MCPKCSKHRITVIILLAFSMLLLAFPASAQLQLFTQPAQTAVSPSGSRPDALFVSTAKSIGHEFTIRTKTTVTGKALYADGDTMWLAGIGSKAGDAPTALALVWTPKESWLGFTWTLQLYSEDGLIPNALLKAGGSGARSVDLAQANPVPGHKYESFLSYDALSGALSLRVTDVTDNTVVYQGGFSTGHVTTTMFATAGSYRKSTSEGQYQLSVDTVEVFLPYMPVGLSWSAGLQSLDNDFMPMLRFEANDTVAIQTKTIGASLPGTLRVLSVDDKATKAIADLQGLTADIVTKIAAAQLPLGKSLIRLEYSEDGSVVLNDTQEITVGVATFKFTNVEVDKERRNLTSMVSVSSDGLIKGLDLQIKATLEELVWSTDKRDFEAKTVETVALLDSKIDIPGTAPLQMPITLRLPERTGYWRVTFKPEIKQSIGSLANNVTQVFSNYAPAKLEPGEPFTIAVLPDTQYHVKNYPHIFNRQVQWIAEQADTRNIVLTLHMGDITDNNTDGQWATAAQGMSLLKGVMPYVLAQGNHDLTQGGGSVQNRNNSLINSYFPVSNQPWITGTFQKDRVENSYSLFTFQGVKYLVLSLEFGPRNEVLTWANNVVAEHPDHKVIMITHNYTGSSGGRSSSALSYDIASNPETSVNAGPEMWYNLVQRQRNFQLVLSGHIHADAIPRQVALGQNRNWVYEMLMDYQSDPNGGNGYLVLFTFYPDGKIEVKAYSPYLGQDRTERDRYGYSNHFIIDSEKGRFLNP